MSESSLVIPSPVDFLDHPIVTKAGCQLYVKREDKIHPHYGGNKWRKLKYNVEAFLEGGYSHLITFGGAFSNHLSAVGDICATHGIPCVGIVRGTFKDPDNPTLSRVKALGMKLHHVTKESYRLKEQSSEVNTILEEYDKPFLIPEGGSNRLALRGVEELMQEEYDEERHYDYVILAAGTGTTSAGVIRSAESEKVIVINALKNPELQGVIESLVSDSNVNWMVNNNFHFGGFARTTAALIDFINEFRTSYGIPLDPIYNGKAMYATLAMVEQGVIPQGSKILYIHTGGLQGITAYNYTCKRESRKLLL